MIVIIQHYLTFCLKSLQTFPLNFYAVKTLTNGYMLTKNLKNMLKETLLK